MGSKWEGTEWGSAWRAQASSSAASLSKTRIVDVNLSYWPNHAVPVGVSIVGRSKDDEWLGSHIYMMPDEAEALGTALIYYAKQLKGEL